MSYQQVDLVEVRAWARTVGAVALDPATGYYAFDYDNDWITNGRKLSPLHMPNQLGTFVFTQLSRQTYYRLPAMLADALPDKFGNALVDAWLADNGIPINRITPLDRLAYAADRSMGALTFHPPVNRDQEDTTAIQLADLVRAAREMVSGEITSAPALNALLRQLIQVGTSAGGARAKAVIAYNRATGQIRPGQLNAPDGFEHWLIKLDGINSHVARDHDPFTSSQGYGRVEYAYYLMALEASIEMSESQLLPEGPRAHFLSRRFDRTLDGRRVHMQSLCGLAHLDFNLSDTHSYNQYLDTIIELGLGRDALAQAFRRIVFNVAAVNRDDHTKNLAFLLPEDGDWQLAPAFDVTHVHNPSGEWTQRHQMSVNGKFDKINLEDLLAVGDHYLIHGYKNVIGEVLQAIDRWPNFAGLSAVDDDTTRRIADDHARHRPR